MINKKVLLGVVLFVLFCSVGYSQTTFGAITGTVMDASGAVVPNATITVTNVDTNISATTKSNEAGVYTVAQLKEGTYKVAVTAAGFQEFVVDKVSIVARDIRRIDGHLQVGTTGTVVEVNGGATLIETETARISDTKSAQTLKTIPMNARWLWAYLQLAPGVVGGSDGTRFAGSLGNQSNWSIDGGTMNDGSGYWIGPLANYIESFQEVKIDSANNSAEFGAVAQVTIISKSGTNQLHASASDYFMTPGLKAIPWFGSSVDRSRFHIFEYSGNGPVYIPKVYNGKDKTFWYIDREGSTGSSSTTFLNPTVPTQAMRNGDFTGMGTIYDPLSGLPFAGNKIPADRINAVSKAFQDRFYPLPNAGDVNTFHNTNYQEAKTSPWNPNAYWVVRIDHRISDKDSLYGRMTRTDGYNNVWEGNLPTVGRRSQHRYTRAFNVTETHTFSPSLLNEFRWGLNLNNNPISGPINGLDLTKQLGIVGLAPDLPNISGMLKVNWSGIGLTTPTEYNYSNPGYRNHNDTFQDYVSWFKNRHSFKFGIDIARTELDEMYADDALFGSVTFASRFSAKALPDGTFQDGNPYADFLLGIPTTAARAFPPILKARNRWQIAGFAQDEFKISPKLTVTLGLRYQQHRPWRENNNLLSIFDIATGQIVVPDGSLSKVSPLFPKDLAPIVEASSVGLSSRAIAVADKTNFAPRLGVAYRPWGANTVFRAGWGMFYDVAPWEMDVANMPYRMSEAAYTNPLSNPDVIFPRVFPAGGTSGQGASLPAAIDPNLKMAYTMQYNFTIEHQFHDTGLRLSYINTSSRKISYTYNYNSPIADSQLYINKPRPFPQYGDIMYRANGGSHHYNGLTGEARRQMLNGLYFQLSGTWARDIGDMTQWDTLENPHDRVRENAVAPDIPTYRATGQMVYQLPFGKGHKILGGVPRIANYLVQGWEYSAVYGFHSGWFLTPTWCGADPTGTFYTGDNTRPNVCIRPDMISNPNMPYDQRTIQKWFNPDAFSAPPVGRFGTSAKGVIKGPHSNTWNMGLAKETKFTERGPLLRLEIQGRNIFNHPNWSNPDTNISGGGPGRIYWAGGIADDSFERQFRLSARIEF